MSEPTITPSGPEGAKAAGKKDAKKAEKLAKFNAKNASKSVAPSSSNTEAKKDKAVKTKKAQEPEYVNTTPAGEKKGAFYMSSYCSTRKLMSLRYIYRHVATYGKCIQSHRRRIGLV
jgi:hypothetical protein